MQQYFDRKKHPLGAWVGIVLVTVALAGSLLGATATIIEVFRPERGYFS